MFKKIFIFFFIFFMVFSVTAQDEATPSRINTYEKSPLNPVGGNEKETKDETPLGFWQSLNRGDLTSSSKPNSQYESTPINPQAPGKINSGSLWWLALQMLAYLIGIIILILLVVYFMKKILPNTNPGFRGGMISIAARFYIDPKKVIYVINIGNRQFFVIGSTPEGLNTLAEITDEELIKDIIEQTDRIAENQANNKFVNIFKKKLKS